MPGIRRIEILVLVVVLWAAWWSLQPQAQRRSGTAAPAAVEPFVQVAPNLYTVAGGGGTTAVFVTSQGVVVVDTKLAAAWPALLEQIRLMTDRPITHVINTHFHGDHTGGNQFLPAETQWVMHERCARRLQPTLEGEPRARAARALTYRDRLSLFDGDDAIDLYAVGSAHTDGDTLVVFRAARVMHSGDVFPAKVAPIINIEGGGHGGRYPGALARAAKAIPGVDRVITGHGPMQTWADFVEYGQFMQTIVDYVSAEMSFGRSKRDVFRAFVLPERFTGYDLDRRFATMDEIDRSLRPAVLRLF